jgi:hypothetical protein
MAQTAAMPLHQIRIKREPYRFLMVEYIATVLYGEVPDDIRSDLSEAVSSVPEGIFFKNGRPLEEGVKELDDEIARGLERRGWILKREMPLGVGKFNVDIASEQKKVLIEIEKGKLPRIELDVLKIVYAHLKSPDRWQYGVLIVPKSHIRLPLEGRRTPFQYVKDSLSKLIEPVLRATGVRGFMLMGYEDPRG